MGDVLEFPSQQSRGLAYLDQQIRKLLEDRGADAQLIDFTASQLVRIYGELSEAEQYSFRITLPAGLSDRERDALQRQITEGLEGVRRENHAMLVRLVAQLVLAEVRLFQHERE